MKIMSTFQVFKYQILSERHVCSHHRINGMKKGSYASQVRKNVKYHRISLTQDNFFQVQMYTT